MKRLLAPLLVATLAFAMLAQPALAAITLWFDITPVVAPLVDGVTGAPKGNVTITPMGGGGAGAALVEFGLTNMAAGQTYHLIAYCTAGPLDGCVPRNYIPSLVDYIHDLGNATADSRGRLTASVLVDGLPDATYGWHLVAAIPGYERYAVVLGNVGRHTHNEQPHEASFDVTLTYGSLCALTQRYAEKSGIAASLCAKLRAADAAAARGDDLARDGVLDAYVQEVAAQADKSISAEHAAILSRLALLLEDAPLGGTKPGHPNAPARPHPANSGRND